MIDIEYSIQDYIGMNGSYAYITITDGLRSFPFSVVLTELNQLILDLQKISYRLKDEE